MWKSFDLLDANDIIEHQCLVVIIPRRNARMYALASTSCPDLADQQLHQLTIQYITHSFANDSISRTHTNLATAKMKTIVWLVSTLLAAAPLALGHGFPDIKNERAGDLFRQLHWGHHWDIEDGVIHDGNSTGVIVQAEGGTS